MEGERDLSAQGGQHLPTRILLYSAANLAISVKKAVAWPPRVPNSVIAKGMKRMSGRLLTPYEYLWKLDLLSTA
jgi:hypothetical protein